MMKISYLLNPEGYEGYFTDVSSANCEETTNNPQIEASAAITTPQNMERSDNPPAQDKRSEFLASYEELCRKIETCFKNLDTPEPVLEHIRNMPLEVFTIADSKKTRKENNILQTAMAIDSVIHTRKSRMHKNSSLFRIIELLITKSEALGEKKIEFINHQNSTEQTPLCLACRSSEKNMEKVVEILLKNGAEASLNIPSKVDGRAPLHILCANQKASVKSLKIALNLLLKKKPELNRPDINGFTPIQLASRRRYEMMIKLAKEGAFISDRFMNNLEKLKSKSQHALTGEHYNIMLGEYEKQKKELAAKTAAIGSSTAIIKATNTQPGESNMTLDGVPTGEQFYTFCKLLTENFESKEDVVARVYQKISLPKMAPSDYVKIMSPETFEFTDVQGNNLLHYVFLIDKKKIEGNRKTHNSSNMKETIGQLIERSKVFSPEKRNIFINQQNSKGKTPLHLACESYEQNVSHYIGQLIAAGASITALTKDNLTPLHCLCRNLKVHKNELLEGLRHLVNELKRLDEKSASEDPLDKQEKLSINYLNQEVDKLIPIESLLKIPMTEAIYLLIDNGAIITQRFYDMLDKFKRSKKSRHYSDNFIQNIDSYYEQQQKKQNQQIINEAAAASLPPQAVATATELTIQPGTKRKADNLPIPPKKRQRSASTQNPPSKDS